MGRASLRNNGGRSDRRARAQSQGVANEIGMARAEHGLTLTAVATRANVAPDTVRRIEAGDPGVQLDTLCAVGTAVGVDIVVRGYRGRSPTLRDTGQLRLAEMLCAIASDTWHPQLELRAGDHGEAADVGFFGPVEILDVEIERLLLDFQAQYRRNRLKCDWLAGQHRRPVRLVLVVEDTARNRAAVAQHVDFLRAVLPAGSRDVLRALRLGEPLGRDGVLWIRRREPPRRRSIDGK